MVADRGGDSGQLFVADHQAPLNSGWLPQRAVKPELSVDDVGRGGGQGAAGGEGVGP